jgi:hypothetical protein
MFSQYFRKWLLKYQWVPGGTVVIESSFVGLLKNQMKINEKSLKFRFTDCLCFKINAICWTFSRRLKFYMIFHPKTSVICDSNFYFISYQCNGFWKICKKMSNAFSPWSEGSAHSKDLLEENLETSVGKWENWVKSFLRRPYCY